MKLSPKQKAIGLVGGSLAVVMITAAGCGDKNNEPWRDAPRDGTDGGPAMIVEMPDGFSNLATKCLMVHGRYIGIRVTVAYHGDNKYGAISQVADPTCK